MAAPVKGCIQVSYRPIAWDPTLNTTSKKLIPAGTSPQRDITPA